MPSTKLGAILDGDIGQGGTPNSKSISSVFVYNRELSAEEIASLYAFPYGMFDEPIMVIDNKLMSEDYLMFMVGE